MLADELRATFLTSGLSEEQLADLIAAGERYPFVEDDELFHEGEPAEHLWILLDGRIDLFRVTISETDVVATMDTPGQWAGGLRAWGDVSLAGYRHRAGSDGWSRVRLPSEDLGRLVGEWFPFGKHMIMGVYQTIRNIDAMARQREALIALGTLAAGLAHEINNPAAAALRAVEGLRDACDQMLSSLADLAGRSISGEQFLEIDRIRRELAERPVPESGAIAEMDREDAVGNWLSAKRVGNPWQLAPVFAAAGADRAWLDQYAGAASADALEPALRWAATTLSATSLLGELTDTTNRISNLVGAVRSYSQLDRATLLDVDVHEGIETTITMLASKLNDIEIERSYDPEVGRIDAYGGELNQVWTNLIDNAVDAMDGNGTLRVRTSRDGDHIVVEITDSGGGIPADVLARVFEPFFTTKDVGRGTGLGLDISRRIVVERHRGDIRFDSRPGSTTAIVRLPISHG